MTKIFPLLNIRGRLWSFLSCTVGASHLLFVQLSMLNQQEREITDWLCSSANQCTEKEKGENFFCCCSVWVSSYCVLHLFIHLQLLNQTCSWLQVVLLVKLVSRHTVVWWQKVCVCADCHHLLVWRVISSQRKEGLSKTRGIVWKHLKTFTKTFIYHTKIESFRL